VKGKTQSSNKWWKISSVFENDDDGAMLQDILWYFFEINPDLSGLKSRPFVLRDLQKWIVKNNWKIRQYYQGFKAHTSESNKVHAMASRINHIFIAANTLGLIERHKPSPISTSPKSMYIDAKVEYVYTGFGKLLAHLIRSMSLESAISNNKDQRKIEKKGRTGFG
jgi:hypothetical protein